MNLWLPPCPTCVEREKADLLKNDFEQWLKENGCEYLGQEAGKPSYAVDLEVLKAAILEEGSK